MKRYILLLISLSTLSLSAQFGLEDIIVETYYISDANDASDTDGPSGLGPVLQPGSVTYRIYVDMAPGFEMQAVYGNDNHLLRLSTTTTFYNNYDRGEETGEAINDSRLDENTVALDSWVTIGAASDAHLAVLKTEDLDGSIVGGANNDGGSMSIPGGLLANENPIAGLPLIQADGLILGTLPTLGQSPGLDLGVFGTPAVPGNELAIGGGGPGTGGDTWFIAEGVVGPTDENRVLIAQITTDGEFSFELNIQIGTPNGDVEQYVASSPLNDEFLFEGLNFPSDEAVFGCTDPLSCNYNPLATQDDASCFFPEPDCSECSSDGTELILIDSDGDGICDAEEVLGCMDELSCNYNPEATDDDGSCLIPEPDCTECNENGTALLLIDSDGDGVCDLEEVFGCTDPDAINYDPLATEDDGTCEFQVGLDEIGDPIQLIAFMENPTSEVLGIRISSIEDRTVLMTVHAMDGRLVQSAQVQILAGDNVIYQDVAYLKQGVYLLRFSWVNSNVTQSFIKL